MIKARIKEARIKKIFSASICLVFIKKVGGSGNQFKKRTPIEIECNLRFPENYEKPFLTKAGAQLLEK